MEPLFSLTSKKLQALVFLNALMLGFTGVVHAQSQNHKGENPPKPAITQEKSGNKQGPINKTGIINKEQSKQKPGKDAENYKGAQPPQGGREGQGPEHHD